MHVTAPTWRGCSLGCSPRRPHSRLSGYHSKLAKEPPTLGGRVRGVKGDGGTGRAQMGQMSMGEPVRTGGLGRMTGVFPKEPSQ